MTFIDYFPKQLVVDPSTGNYVPGVDATGIFDGSDTGLTTPLTITDLTGIPMTLNSGPNGVTPDFKCDGHTQLLVQFGDLVVPLDSLLAGVLAVIPTPIGQPNGLMLMTSDDEYVVAEVASDGSVIPSAAGQPDGIPMEVLGGAWALGVKKAPLDSPALTGNPTAPTPSSGDNDTSIATTAFVADAVSGKAPTASPTFTGDPKAPTPTAGDNDTSIATTAFVTAAIAAIRGAYISMNAQTGTTYSAVLGDVGKLVTLTNTGAITVTLPKDATQAVPVGSRIDFIGLGTGLVTFAAESGATIAGTPTLISRAQYSAVTAIKTASNTWVIVGDLG